MKTRAFVTMIFAWLCLASCTKTNSNLASTASQSAVSGAWKVSLFQDSNSGDETSNFSGYSFVFNSTGTVTATNGGTAKNGTWSVSSSSGKFIIDLGPKDNSNRPLGELSDDWRIISVSDSQIRLKDDNNNELLTFSKL
jgi:hypothetical protein